MEKQPERFPRRIRMPNRQSGLTLIETLIAIIIGLMFVPVIIAYLSLADARTVQKNAASQMQMFGEAVTNYVNGNLATVEAGATSSTAYAISPAMLQAGGYLPGTFGTANPWNQQYGAWVLQPSAGNLEVVAYTTGGRGYVGPNDATFADGIVPGAAVMIGAQGGYVSTNDVPGTTFGGVRGSYGGWTASWPGNITNPGPGHLAYFTYFSQGTLSTDYLYRVAVPGNPGANTMNTDLNMGGNNINNGNNISLNGAMGTNGLSPTAGYPSGWMAGVHAWNVYANSNVGVGQTVAGNPQAYMDNNGNVYANSEVTANGGYTTLSRSVQYVTVVSPGSWVLKPNCNVPGSPTLSGEVPQIFASVANAATPGGYPMAAISVYTNTASNPAYWRVDMAILTQQGWIYDPPATGAEIQVLTKCS